MKSFLTKLYSYKFFDDLILVYPVYSLLFQDSGLNTFEISLLLIIWASTGVLFEVPFGVLADKYSRKNLLLIGEIIRAIGYSFWLFGDSFSAYAIGFILWGLKGVLTSGTLEALIYDELKHYKKENLYEEINGKLKSFGFIGVTIAMIFGGFIAEYSYSYTLIPSIIAPLIAGSLIWSIKPVAILASTKETKYFSLLKSAIVNSKNNPILLRVMIYSVLVTSVYGSADEFWALLFKDLGITLGVIGILFAIGNGISALAGYTIQYFKNVVNLDTSFIVVASILILCAAVVFSPWTVVLIFISTYLLELALLRIQAKLQHEIKSNERATITSINSLLVELVAIATSLTIGYFSNQIGMVFVLYLLGSVLLISTICFKFLKTSGYAGSLSE